MSTKLTRRQILTEKYIEFQSKMKELIGTTLNFPSLEDYDICDLLIFFNMTFGDSNDIEKIISELLNPDIPDYKYREMIELVREYVTWIRLFQQ